MEIFLGRCTSVLSDDKKLKFVIKFTIDNYIEDAIAYPVDVYDEPEVGCPVMIFGSDTIFGYSFLYQKLRLEDHTRLKIGNSKIDLYDEGIEIETINGSNVSIDSDGCINIKSNAKITIESAAMVDIKGSVKMDSKTVNPTGTGPFCAIPICPYTGQPHVGNILA